MKKLPLFLSGMLIFVLVLGTSRVFAQTEIAIEEDEPTPAKKAAPTTPPQQAAPAQTVPSQTTPAQEDSEEVEVDEAEEQKPAVEEKTEAQEETEAVEEEEPTSSDMRSVYEAGIKAYQHKDYRKAITLLSRAAEMKDRRTPKFYYAEAHAMLGVIFQYFVVNKDKACRHYRMALKIDPKTRTALRHKNQVCR